ncbi:MAG: adenylate/guanylate cyclase domain-containing protein, partial [Bdellovibrionales bacterium]|nr:adenylate/guanylate cyclase domain-containing protein [Bdellovibrionales bacterium]
FTHFSSQMKPQEVVDLLNIYFSDMIEVFIEHGVTLDKFIGDGILAYVTLDDETSKQNIENITKAAFEMHIKLASTNQKLKNKKLPKIQLGLSLHIGPVILGAIGSRDKQQFTIIGDPVNVAARLESFCKEHQVGIIASSSFVSQISPEMNLKFVSLGRQKIRGIQLPLEIFGALPLERKQLSA